MILISSMSGFEQEWSRWQQSDMIVKLIDGVCLSLHPKLSSIFQSWAWASGFKCRCLPYRVFPVLTICGDATLLLRMLASAWWAINHCNLCCGNSHSYCFLRVLVSRWWSLRCKPHLSSASNSALLPNYCNALDLLPYNFLVEVYCRSCTHWRSTNDNCLILSQCWGIDLEYVQVMRWYGFFKEAVPESPLENHRVRKLVICHYLADGTTEILEPRVTNSGIWQVMFLFFSCQTIS